MSRSQPYRPRMPIQLLKTLDVASRITLFMVGQSGPLSFTFQDRLGNKVKTSIGADVKCSCSPGKGDHCIHTLYVLLRIFKVPPLNPLLWQTGYIDSQLTDLLSGKYTTISNRSIIHPNFSPEQYFLSDLPSDILVQKTIEKFYLPQQPIAQRLKLNNDTVCPICQQPMTQDQCLSYCKVKCGNNFHLECLRVWAQHKSTTESSITCPMCRCAYGPNYLLNLEYQEKQYEKNKVKKIVIKFKCDNCGVQQIPKNVHKCLLCTSYELCQACYLANKHIKHPFIRQLQNNPMKWCGAQERRTQELKIKNYIEMKRKEKKPNELLLQKLRKVSEDPNKLIDFVVSAYPYVSKYISDNIDPFKKLDFNPQDVRCMKCSSKRMTFLRRLPCGHFIDHECLKQNFQKRKYYCEQCCTKLVKGYQNLLMREQQLYHENKQNIMVSDEFNPQKMNNSQENYNFILSKGPTLAEVLGGKIGEKKQNSDQSKTQIQIENSFIRGAQIPKPARPYSMGSNLRTSVLQRNKSTSDKKVFQLENEARNNLIRIRNANTGKSRMSCRRGSVHTSKSRRGSGNNQSLQGMDSMIEVILGKKFF